MSYPTLKKYFCSCTNNKEIYLERKKRIDGAIACGWIAPNNKWINVTSFHTHPEYLYQLDKTKIASPSSFIDEEILGTFRSKGTVHTKTEHYYNKLLEISYECIQNGSIRVTTKDDILYLNANSLKRLNEGYKIIDKIKPITTNVVGEIININGVCLQTFEFDIESNCFKKAYV